MHCKYCAFATHQAHLHAPDEVEALLDGAARRRSRSCWCSPASEPEVNPGVAAAAARSSGTRTSSAYVAWVLRARAGARAAAAHQPRRAVARRPRAAARGDRVAGADARVGQPRPRRAPGLADQAPRRGGWRRSAPPASCGSRSPAASSSASARRPRSASRRCEALAAVHAEHGHLQEVILQNFVPHRRYYGEEPAEIADRGRRATTGAPGSARRPELDAARVGDAGRRSRTWSSWCARRAAADARRRRPGPAEPRRLVAASSSPRARPTSAG